MTENEFERQRRAAVERMKEMNLKSNIKSSGKPMPPVPSFVNVNGAKRQPEKPIKEEQKNIPLKPELNPQRQAKNDSFLSGLNIPFLDKLKGETDIALIIGLILILMSEKADKKLLFALVYILM